jgi:AraC-like DNA-binding protein
VDTVSAVLDGHRARGAFVLRCTMSPPWAVRIADRAAVALLVVHRGQICVAPSAGPPIRLAPGDAAIVKRAEPYLLADDPATPPSMVIEPGQICRPLQPADSPPWPSGDGRGWGNDPEGSCRFVVGVYELAGQITGRLLHDLPDLLVVPAAHANAAAIGLLTAEVQRELPGQDLILDRLVDLILIDTLRAWLTQAGDAAPPWWRAQHDPIAGTALQLIHDHPDHAWTLASLAVASGVSRATLARRFTHQLGQPPLAYLTEWRLARAADLLRSTTDTVEHVAHQVGYGNAFAFSTAFKRHYGHSPRDHRRRQFQATNTELELG